MHKARRFAIALLAISVAVSAAEVVAATPAASDFPVTHGLAAGDVTLDSAVIWSRTDRRAVMHVVVHAQGEPRHYSTPVTAQADYTGKVAVDNLEPATRYTYKVWFGAAGQKPQASDAERHGAKGHFRTPPAPDTAAPVTLAWGGDIGGQNVCRDAERGFPVFEAISAAAPDLLIGLGDLIYADGTCEDTGRYGNAQVPGDFGPAADLATYWAHWRYNRADSGYQEVLAKTPFYAIWDDHEVVNNFGPLSDTRDAPPYTAGEHLLPLGRRAFLDYNPVREAAATPGRLYRTVRWGRHLELFILDARQYRDANRQADDAELRKTMLGREQLVWLKRRLEDSDATWKVIVSSVPMSIGKGGDARDAWADYNSDQGFENELLDILRFMRAHEIDNSVWITGDVHFAAAFRYEPFGEDSELRVHEFVSSPLNAGLGRSRGVDTTLGTERLFLMAREGDNDEIASYEQALGLMNFGLLRVRADGRLDAQIVNALGESVYELSLQPD